VNVVPWPQKGLTLKFSLGSAFVATVLLTGALLGFVLFGNARKFIREEVKERLKASVAIAAIQIDGEAHARLQSMGDEQSAEYARLQKVLRQMKAKVPSIRFLYTFRKMPAGNVVFVVDAEEDPAELSHLGDVYDDVTPELLATFTAPHRVRVDEDFYTDKWGTWISSYAPFFRANGELEGVLGMDMAADDVIAYENRFLTTVVGIIAGVSVLIAFLGWLFARRISQPLVTLADDMNRIERFDLTETPESKSRIREVVEMEKALDNMKKGLRSFRRYVPSELVADLIGMKQEAVLGAQRRELTIFFSDIANFTALCEKLTPDQLISCLDEYFNVMTGSILSERGTVDKFIGDAVMAFWGAPRLLEDHAVLACRAALQCQRNLDALFETWIERGLPPVTTRIGINTGEVLVGNVGFKERLSYTVLGDDVNLASRLESLNKYYGTRIIISEKTYKAVYARFEARLLDRVVVKGKTEGVRVYELVGEKGGLDKDLRATTKAYNDAMDLYLNRKWAEALAIFDGLALRRPDDRPIAIQRARCAEYVATPPPEDWTGVVVLREK
jgi:class 3 adenylate cyclase